MSKSLLFKATCSLLSGLIVIAFGHTSFAQPKITLEQAIDSAVNRNIQVRQAQFDASISEEDYKLAKGATLPTLNGSVASYRMFGRAGDSQGNYSGVAATVAQGTLFADVTIFQGFAKMNEIKENKYLLDATKNSVEKAKNDLMLLVLYTYLKVLTNRDLLAAAKQQLALAKEEVSRQEKFFKVGQKTLADLSQARSQVSNAQANQTNAQNEMERAYLTLAHLMERDGSKPFLVVEPSADQIDKLNLKYTLKDVYTKALKSYPDVLLAENKRLAADKGIEVAKGQISPTLTFGAGITSSYSSSASTLLATQITGAVPIGVVSNTNATVIAPVYQSAQVSFADQVNHNFEQVAGFSLTIPIANGFKTSAGIRKAKLRYQNALATEELAKDNLSKTIAEAVWDMHATQKRYTAAVQTFKSAQDAFKVMRDRYTVGLANSLDINVAENDRNIAEYDLIQTKYELILKSKVIDYYLGNTIKFD